MSDKDRQSIVEAVTKNPWLLPILAKLLEVYEHGEGGMTVEVRDSKTDKSGNRLREVRCDVTTTLRPLGRDSRT